MYRALYRKYRPASFGDVVGQEAITTALSNQILADKVGHAYLFTGTRGTGKTSCAKIFAKAVNCEHRNGADPCGVCDICTGLDDGSILDVSEIDAASNNGVDDIRALRDETAYRPSRCRYRVYIIDEVHMLSASAFNALLKIMEEPPRHVIFILATTEIHKVPATIVSRCQRYDFGRIAPEKIAARLVTVAEKEEIQLTETAADLLARLADGALRDALSLLDTCAGVAEIVDEDLVRRMAGVTDKEYLFAFSEAARQGKVASLLELVAALREKSIDVKRLAEELVNHYRLLMLADTAPDGALLTSLPKDEREKYLQAAPGVGEAAAIDAVRKLAAAMDKMGRSPDPRIELEVALFDIAAPAPSAAPTQPRETPRPTAPPNKVLDDKPDAPVSESVPTKQPNEAQETKPDLQPKGEAALARTQALPQDGTVLFEAWGDVVAAMAPIDKMLHTYMKNGKAYWDGRRVLFDCGEMFLSYMRDYGDAAQTLKDVIQQVCGVRYAIGPYTPPESEGSPQKQNTLDDAVERLRANDVEIEIV